MRRYVTSEHWDAWIQGQASLQVLRDSRSISYHPTDIKGFSLLRHIYRVLKANGANAIAV